MSIENFVSLTGNLGNEVDTKYTQGGTAIAKISLATTSKRKDKDGNVKEETSWHRVVFFGRLAEVAAEYLRKGSKIQINGTLRYGEYTDGEGIKRYSTDIIADHMLMLSAKQESGERQQRQERPAQQQRQAPPMDDFADDDREF